MQEETHREDTDPSSLDWQEKEKKMIKRMGGDEGVLKDWKL